MEWDKEAVGYRLRRARRRKKWSMLELSRRAGVKVSVVSSLERGLHRRPPNRDTQAKLEAALGTKLRIPRGNRTAVYFNVPGSRSYLLDELVRRFPDHSQAAAILQALEDWKAHQEALDEWKEQHGGKI